MSISPLTFTGVSSFSNDFQTILNRNQQIASLPLTALQNRDSDVLQKKQQLATLGSSISDFGTALAGLASTSGSRALSASSTNSSAVSATSTGASTPASYTINSITSTASAASETSTSGYADSSSSAVSSTGQVRLVVGTKTYDISLTSGNNNLVGLENAINGLNAGVSASILTTGTGATPNYLTVSALQTGATTLRLIDDPNGAATNLLTQTNQGSDAQFQLNGVPVKRSNNVVNDVVSGLTFALQNTTSSPVTLTLATDRTQLSAQLQNFVAKYNSLVTQVGAQVGPSAGLLSGDYVVRQVQDTLRQISSYSGTGSNGSIRSLADLGLQFSSTGQLSFDPSVFNGLTGNQISDAFQFLGSAATGLGSISKQLTALTDPVTGLVKAEQDGFDQTDRQLQGHITDLTARISQLQTSLSLRLQAADTLIAQLQSQQKIVTASLYSLSPGLFQDLSNPNGTNSTSSSTR